MGLDIAFGQADRQHSQSDLESHLLSDTARYHYYILSNTMNYSSRLGTNTIKIPPLASCRDGTDFSEDASFGYDSDPTFDLEK